MRMFWSFFSNTDNKHVRGAFTENETWKWKHTKCLLRQNMITFGTKMSLNWKNCSVFFWLLPTRNSALKHWRASESFASVGAQIKKNHLFLLLALWAFVLLRDQIICSHALHPVCLIRIHWYQQQATPLGHTRHWDDGELSIAFPGHITSNILCLRHDVVTNKLKWMFLNVGAVKHLVQSTYRNL